MCRMSCRPSASSQLGVVVPQGFDEAVNPAQGRMQIMGHRGVEHLQVVVQGVELDRAVPHALFQVGIEPVDLGFGLLCAR